MTAKPSHGAPPSSSATELGISVLLQSTIAIDDQQNGICGRLAAHDVATAGYWLSDGPQRPAFCLVSTAFRGSVLIIPGIVGSSPTRPTGSCAAQKRGV